MQINTDVYPEVGYDSYSRWSNDTVYYSASQHLEHSIFYSGTISENVQFCDENNYSYIAEAPNCAFTVTPREIVKGDIFFIKDGYRHFNFNGEWVYYNSADYNIVTEFDISQFYFDLDKLTVHVYDTSQPDGGHAIGNVISMTFTEYRNKSAEYKATHLIRDCLHNWGTGQADSFLKYKNVANYADVNVVPMIRYVFNDKTTLYLPFGMLTNYANLAWQGPYNLDSFTGFGKFGYQLTDIYLPQYPGIGKWSEGWTPGSAAQAVTMANCGNVESLVIHAGSAGQQVQQIINGYHMPDLATIDTDKYAVPVFLWGNRWDKRVEAFYTDEFIMRYFASSGLRFKVDDVMYIGYMDANGQCNGNYILESELADSDSANKNITDFTGSAYDADVPYVPPTPPSPSEDDSYANMGIGVGTGVGGYTTFALMTMNDLVDLLADFNANLVTGMSVVNNFICLYKLGPLSSYLCSTRVGNIIMSANASTNFVSVRADYSIVTSQKNVIALGSYNVPRKTNTFYDFAPYSTYELFIPCCGWVPLPDTVAGRTIDVYLIIDLASCTCKGVCRIGGTTVAEASGVLGVSVPFFSTDSGIKRVADLMAVTQVIGGIAQGAVGANSGSGTLVVSGTMNAIQGLEQHYINGNTNYTAIKGGNGDITAVGNGEYCTVKITHPVVDEVVNNSRFGHSVGYLCNTVGKIKDFKGLTICANPHITGIDCTESEKEEIKRLLEEGIIVN